MEAVHLPGGNYFDDVRLDIAASFSALERPRERPSVRRGRLRNTAAMATFAVEWKTGLREPLVFTGVRRAWFEEFAAYWSDALGGRPLTVADFHGLNFAYRQRAQLTTAMEWGTATEHVSNWTAPENLAATFRFVYGSALKPVRSKLLRRLLPRGGRVLEYGCSIAPMYRTWRAFFSHVPCTWVLADLPTFPFHFARHTYARDLEASFVEISADALDDPLRAMDGNFDLIIVQEVFEHLHAPRRMAEYLLDRLNPDGMFAFDYIRKDAALGHDTPAGVAERIETIEYLNRELEILHGRLEVGPETVSFCAGRRRATD